MGRGENQGEGHIFKAEIFQMAYLTTCTFQNTSASGASPMTPIKEMSQFKNNLTYR